MAKNMYQKREERKKKALENNENNGVNKSVINWYPGHMAKAKREIKDNLNLIDVVIELIDARIPYSSKNDEISDLIKDKPRILIMTKKDLCDINVTKSWVKYYEDKGYSVFLFDLLKDNVNNIILEINKLTSDIMNKRIDKGMKVRKARTLILGIPNVGKSTFINKLVGRKATNVGNKPGVTKSLQWIRINEKIELLDTPGILMPKLTNDEIAYNLASMNSIKEEVVRNDKLAIFIINKLLTLYPDRIESVYHTDSRDVNEILDFIGNTYKFYDNREIDYDLVCNRIINDMKHDKFGLVTFDSLSN